MKTVIIKSLLPSLCQREEMYPSLAKRGEGRFFNNDALLRISLVSPENTVSFCRKGETIYSKNSLELSLGV
jgi:hypothetical protein